MSKNTPLRTPLPLDRQDTEVYQTILGRIQRGEISGDDRIVDKTLASEFGISRMPARQALLRLVHEGYLAGTTRGFVLPDLSDNDIKDIFEIRMLLEPRAAGTACQAMDQERVNLLYRCKAEAQAAVVSGDARTMMQANDDFRQVWLDAVPNQRLAESIRRFVDHVQIVRHATIVDVATQYVVLGLLDGLADAFARRDVIGVQDLTEEFVTKGREYFFSKKRATQN